MIRRQKNLAGQPVAPMHAPTSARLLLQTFAGIDCGGSTTEPRVREDLKGPRKWFSCFAVRLIYAAASGAGAETNMRPLIANAGRLGRLFKLDHRILEIEYAMLILSS